MGLAITTDSGEIRQILHQFVEADPVRNTVLGSVGNYLETHNDGWCVHSARTVAARSSADHPVALSAGWTEPGALIDALRNLSSITGLGGPVPTVEALVDGLGRPVVHRLDERLYRLDELDAPGVVGRDHDSTAADLDLLTRWYEDFLVEAFGRVPPGPSLRTGVETALATTPPVLWTDATGEPVAMAAWRITGSRVARIGPVFTPVAARARGYGSAVTAAVVRRVRQSGRVPVLYTDLANPTSNRIYRRLGFVPVEDRVSVSFS